MPAIPDSSRGPVARRRPPLNERVPECTIGGSTRRTSGASGTEVGAPGMSEQDGRRRLARATGSVGAVLFVAVMAFAVLATRALVYGADVWGWLLLVALVGGVALRAFVVLASMLWNVRLADWVLLRRRRPTGVDDG